MNNIFIPTTDANGNEKILSFATMDEAKTKAMELAKRDKQAVNICTPAYTVEFEKFSIKEYLRP
ncbi:MAG: hypothetical protein V4613_03590 [Bacteroidota bacterium]